MWPTLGALAAAIFFGFIRGRRNVARAKYQTHCAEVTTRRDANARAAMPGLTMDWPRVHKLLYGNDLTSPTAPSTREVCTAAYIVADEMEIARNA